jgi:hypothetical protein
VKEAAVVSVMGGHRALGRRVRTPLEMAELIELGIPQTVAPHLRERLKLTERELARPRD